MADILIVDDDCDFRDAMRFTLEAEGYTVRDAASRPEGLREVAAHKPDLIVLDVMMDTPDAGFRFAHELRTGDNRDIPILMVTSCLRDDAFSKAVGVKMSAECAREFFPVDDFVEKPIRPADLVRRARALLQQAAGNP